MTVIWANPRTGFAGFPTSVVHSAVHPRYDMDAVVFPSGRVLKGVCRHGVRFVSCRSCHITTRWAWIDRDQSDGKNMSSCAFCSQTIIHYRPSPVGTIAYLADPEPWAHGVRFQVSTHQDRYLAHDHQLRAGEWTEGRWAVSFAPDVTHGGERGCWYLNRTYHWECLVGGDPAAFLPSSNDDTQRSLHDVAPEWDAAIPAKAAKEDREITNPETEPDVQPLETLEWKRGHWATPELDETTAAEREEARYNAMCGPVTMGQMPLTIRCGNCKQKHASAAMVKACYRTMRNASQKKGK